MSEQTVTDEHVQPFHREWSPQEDELLRELWEKGLSGNELAMKFGRTRGSIHGRAKRMGLSRRREYVPPGQGKGRQRIYKPKKTTSTSGNRDRKVNLDKLFQLIAPLSPTEPAEEVLREPEYIPGISLALEALDLGDGRCRWPVNDPPKGEEFFFCGGAVVGNSPYCGCHTQRAWSRLAV